MQKANSSWRLSRYIHFLRRGPVHAIYHTLNKTLIFIGRKDFRLINKIYRRNIHLTKDVIKRHRLPKLLKANGFLKNNTAAEEGRVLKILNAQQPKTIRLSSLYLVVTTACNYRCRYCFIAHNVGQQPASTMDWHTLRQGIDLFAQKCDKKGFKTIVFYGGEPLLAASLVKRGILYIKREQKLGAFGRGEVRIGINTNGSRLNDGLLRFFKRHRCMLGISLDGPKAINDRARVKGQGQGTFDEIAQILDRVKRHKLPYIISLTIGKHNIYKLQKNIDYLLKRFQVPKLGFNFIFDFFCGSNPYAVSASQLLPELRQFYSSRGKQAILEDLFRRRYSAFYTPFEPFIHCNAYGKQLVVLPDKKIGPCHAFAGTLENFMPLESSPWKNNLWKRWSKRTITGNKQCRRCKYILFCGGGCAYRAFTAFGDINKFDPLNCRLAKLWVDLYILFTHLHLEEATNGPKP